MIRARLAPSLSLSAKPDKRRLDYDHVPLFALSARELERERDYKFRSGANNNLLNLIFPLPRTCEKASNIVEDSRTSGGGAYL